jgi:hypothetical protein
MALPVSSISCLYFLTSNAKKFKEKGASFELGLMLPSSDLFTVDSLPLSDSG